MIRVHYSSAPANCSSPSFRSVAQEATAGGVSRFYPILWERLPRNIKASVTNFFGACQRFSSEGKASEFKRIHSLYETISDKLKSRRNYHVGTAEKSLKLTVQREFDSLLNSIESYFLDALQVLRTFRLTKLPKKSALSVAFAN